MVDKVEPKNKVDYPGVGYKEMATKWDLPNTLLSGTDGMRRAREKYLPREVAEELKAYNNRLKRSFLFEAFGDTVDKCAAAPYSKPVTVKNAPPELAMLEKDVDGTGRSLTQLGNECMATGAAIGGYHLLVDYPAVPDADKKTKADETAEGLRPNIIQVTPGNLIGWRAKRQPGGAPVLTQIRILETALEPDGAYGEVVVKRIRVYNTDTWELWEKKPDAKEYSRIEGPHSHSFAGIPLVTVYFKRTGFLTMAPPLEKLAWMNLAHWQSNSDQRNILRFARFALLFGKGFSKPEIDKGFAIGPTRMIATTNPEADLSYVEHSGNAIQAGQNDVEHLEEIMEVLGLDPFLKKRQAATATSQEINADAKEADIQAWIRAQETGYEEAYAMAGRWIKLRAMPTDFSVDVFNNFALGFRTKDDVEALQKMRDKREISHNTFINEVKSRGVLSEDVDPEDEREALEEEGPGTDVVTAARAAAEARVAAQNADDTGADEDEGDEGA